MTEKTKTDKMSNFTKPVPMKLFAAWEVDRTPPNCVPRLCSLTITRLTLLTPLPSDVTSVSLAVKMHSSKRTLRSHEITVVQPPTISTTNTTSTTAASTPSQVGPIPSQTGGVTPITPGGPGGLLLDTELDLHFSLQYPHFIKGNGNRLQILLQRRKKYKSRTILGYKTLCEGSVRMDQVLQRSRDMLIELGGDLKGGLGGVCHKGGPIATLMAHQVSSIPVDHDHKNNNSVMLADRANEYSDEDEEAEFSSVEERDDDAERDVLSGYGSGSKRPYAGVAGSKRGLGGYRKLQHGGGGVVGEDSVLGGHGDSDSEFEQPRKGIKIPSSRQRNLKQKFVALLRRFKVPDELEAGGNRVSGALGSLGPGDQEIDALFQELESLSCGEADDSGGELDTVSIGSTPKPSLRPFFSSSRSLLQDSSNPGLLNPAEKSLMVVFAKPGVERQLSAPVADRDRRGDSSGNEGVGQGSAEQQTDPELCSSDPQNTNSPPRDKDGGERRSRLFRATNSTQRKKHSLSINTDLRPLEGTMLSPTNFEPRRSLMEALGRALPPEDCNLPDVLTLTSGAEAPSAALATRVASLLSGPTPRPTLAICNNAEVRAVLTALLNKIHKYYNSNAKSPPPVKILLLGGDGLIGTVLRNFVELLGLRPPDWLGHIRFYLVPICTSNISRYLCTTDPAYCQLFGGDSWQHLLERIASPDMLKTDAQDISNRVQRYLTSSACVQLPIAEAMISTKEEDSGQNFVPFVSDVRVGTLEGPQASLDLEENSMPPLSSSPPLGNSISGTLSGLAGRVSPPTTPVPADRVEALELQIDYWQIPRQPPGAVKSQAPPRGLELHKSSLKSSFRSLQVLRPPDASLGLSMAYATKEKKQKIMRLGKKKEKDKEGDREQNVDGVSRLICSPKASHATPLRVLIDSAEWTGVKFFQLSWQWQTHVKYFPVALVGAPLAPNEIA